MTKTYIRSLGKINLIRIKWLLLILIAGFYGCNQAAEQDSELPKVDLTALKELELRLAPSEFHTNALLDSIFYVLEASALHPELYIQLNKVYRELGWRYVDQKNYGQAVVSFNLAIKTARYANEIRDLIFALMAKGQLFESFNDYKEAARNYHEALERSIAQKETVLTLSVYHAFSSMEIHRGDFPKARFYALKGIAMQAELLPTNEEQRLIMQLYNDLGLGYQFEGIFKKAIQSYHQAIEIDNRTTGNKAGFIYGNIGAAYGELEQLDSAIFYLNQDYQISEENNDLGSMYSSSITMAEFYTNAKNYEYALNMLNKSDSLRNLYPNVLNATGTARLRVKLLQTIKSKDDQLKALNEYVVILSNWLEENKRINEQQLRALVSINSATNRLEKLEKAKSAEEARKNRLALYLILALITGIIVVLGLFIRNRYIGQQARIDRLTLEAKKSELELLRRDKLLQEKELKIQNQMVESQTQQLNDSERRHKQAVLAKEYVIDLKNKFITNLLSAIEPIDQLPAAMRSNIEVAVRNISQLEENSFIKNFDAESGHADFGYLLQERYPELSSDEIRLCTLLRLNMTTKEIARLKMITIAGVNKSRNRLRKKFNLKPEEDLNAFLMSI